MSLLLSEYRFMVEARDNDGAGNVATVPLTISVTDVNDSAPKFLRDPMDFILDKDGLGFSDRAFIKVSNIHVLVQYNITRGHPCGLSHPPCVEI